MLEFTKLIPIVALCLAFSMVSERIANFLKLYLPAFTKLIPFKYSIEYLKKSAFVLDNLHLKQTNQELEVIRERIILLLSLFSGLLVAYFSKGEILEMLPKDSPKDHWTLIIGFGILFSFGSKFWHDMLDLLLFTKNLRRRWGEIDVNEFSSAKQLSDRLQVTDQALVKQAIEENKAWLYRDFPGIRIILPRYEFVNDAYQHCVVIYLEKDDRERIPSSLDISGSGIKVPVVVVPNLGLVRAHGAPGEKVLDTKSDTFGSFGCLVKHMEDQKHYILTCAHVVTGRKISITNAEMENLSFDVIPENNLKCKEEHFKFEGGYDCALIGPVTPGKHHNKTSSNTAITAARNITAQDNGKEIYIKTNRRGARGINQGRIEEWSKPNNITVHYNDGTKEFPAMIAVKSNSIGAPLTIEGDSGSVIYDKNGDALGIIIGGDAEFSYAIPIVDALNELKVSID